MIASLALAVTPDRAEACSGNNHCYALAYWGTPNAGNDGADVILRSNCMTLGDASSSSITNEVWVMNNDSQNSWVEAGLKKGYPVGGTRYFFWADMVPSGAYHHHESTDSWSLSTDYTADIQHLLNEGSGVWEISVGDFSGTSTNNFSAPSKWLETGLETTSGSSPSSHGGSKSMSWYDASQGLIHYSWESGSDGHAALNTVGSGTSASWDSTYDHVSDGIGASC